MSVNEWIELAGQPYRDACQREAAGDPRDARIAALEAQVADLSAQLQDVPVFAIDRYIDNSDPHEQYASGAEGDADIYLIMKWLGR